MHFLAGGWPLDCPTCRRAWSAARQEGATGPPSRGHSSTGRGVQCERKLLRMGVFVCYGVLQGQRLDLSHKGAAVQVGVRSVKVSFNVCVYLRVCVITWVCVADSYTAML